MKGMSIRAMRKGNSKYDILILTKRYENKLNEKTKGEFRLNGRYNDKVVSITHEKCNRSFELHPRYFLGKLSCPLCEKEVRYKKRIEKTKEVVSEFKKYLKDAVGEEYIVIEDFMNPDERKVSLEHKCGHQYKVKINSFRNGRRCPICTKTQPKSPSQYELEFKNITGGRFELLTPYERAVKKVEIKCNVCEDKSWVNPSSFLRDSRCPKCEKKHPGNINKSKKNEVNFNE